MTFNIDSFWFYESRDHMTVAQDTFATLKPDFKKLLNACEKSVKKGGKIILFGNGGSAADAQHLATEFTVRYIKNRKPIPALALTTDTSALTAIGNDFGFEDLFARQIEALGKKGDIAIGISTSGKSANVLKALKQARQQKLVTVGFTGAKGMGMKKHCDILLPIPSTTTARIQEMHITLGQMLCGALEQKLDLV